MDVTDSDLAAIRETAYFKWLAAGAPPSDGIEYWLASECEHLERHLDPAAPQTPRLSTENGARANRSRPRADKDVLIGAHG